MADPVAACEKAGVTLPESEFILCQRQGAANKKKKSLLTEQTSLHCFVTGI